MTAIHFEDEAPGIPETLDEIQAFADGLREHPGRWALYGQQPGAMGSTRSEAWGIRRAGTRMDGTVYSRRLTLFAPVNSFETHAVTLFGERRIYVRFVGTKEGTS